MEAERIRVNLQLEKGLNFLGTLGSNAPFIGLFGTVLGIIHAFKDLAVETCGGPAVMAGIAEALVATAVGLLVAIPAVVMYNYFHSRLHVVLERSRPVGTLLARLSSSDQEEDPHSVELQTIGGRRWNPPATGPLPKQYDALCGHRAGHSDHFSFDRHSDDAPHLFHCPSQSDPSDKLEKTVVIISIDREGQIAINGTKVPQDQD